jgi:hypothetical protein
METLIDIYNKILKFNNNEINYEYDRDENYHHSFLSCLIFYHV